MFACEINTGNEEGSSYKNYGERQLESAAYTCMHVQAYIIHISYICMHAYLNHVTCIHTCKLMCIHVTELEEELESFCSDSEDVELESVDFLLRPLDFLDFFAFLPFLPTFFFLFLTDFLGLRPSVPAPAFSVSLSLSTASNKVEVTVSSTSSSPSSSHTKYWVSSWAPARSKTASRSSNHGSEWSPTSYVNHDEHNTHFKLYHECVRLWYIHIHIHR